MAADEMRSITTDKWADDVWGVASTGDPVAKLFFYFGRNDHWVAEKTRDEIIALKGSKNGLGPKMFVCEEGLPHAFCLSKSCQNCVSFHVYHVSYLLQSIMRSWLRRSLA